MSLTSVRQRAIHALVVTALVALAQASASAAPCYATLVIRHSVPLSVQSTADTAVFAEAEQLAETYQLYFRLNPIVPDAVHRDATCVPGATALVFSDVLVLYSLSRAASDSLVVRVSLGSCTSGGVVLSGESPRAVSVPNVNAAIVRSGVHDAFASLGRHIDADPAAARSLGVVAAIR